MDEDIYNKMMSDEQQRIEREAKTITRGCGMMFLVIAVVVAVILALSLLCRVLDKLFT